MTDPSDTPNEPQATVSRRGALADLAALTASSLLGVAGLAAAPARAQSAGHELPAGAPAPHGPIPPADGPRVAMLVYDRMVLLDLVGPQTVLNVARCQIDLVARTAEPVATDLGIAVTPTATFASYRHAPDVVFVPGGLMGSLTAMQDDATLDWLRAAAEPARYVTSVCTGSLVLGAAGLLRGYRATSHWGVRDLLPILGATPSPDRVVEDRGRITGGGVTAGIDFGLVLAERLVDRETAERAQLIVEYAPDPPFAVGTPELAGADRVAEARGRRVWMDEQARLAAEAAARKLAI